MSLEQIGTSRQVLIGLPGSYDAACGQSRT
jgi:hypothetical protein